MARPNVQLAKLSAGKLVWIEEAGVGYFECENPVYDAAYFDRYAAQANTGIGPSLNLFRADLLSQEMTGLRQDPGGVILDVGIGDGAFLRAATDAPCFQRFAVSALKGFDINPAGIAWLKDRDMWGELYERTWPAATFWDSLEHIRDPAAALAQVETLAIVSIPIFTSVSHVLASRHYRKDEHYWYFTRSGFLSFASSCGFECEDILLNETVLGRDGIETFVLRRSPVAVG